jgi:hypothetical protein
MKSVERTLVIHVRKNLEKDREKMGIEKEKSKSEKEMQINVLQISWPGGHDTSLICVYLQEQDDGSLGLNLDKNPPTNLSIKMSELFVEEMNISPICLCIGRT